MEGEGLMKGVLEDPPTAMDVDTDVNDRLPSSQMQDIKALLTALSLLSRSVEVPNKLFRRITSIAQKSDTVDQVFEIGDSVGQADEVKLEGSLQLQQPSDILSNALGKVTSTENGSVLYLEVDGKIKETTVASFQVEPVEAVEDAIRKPLSESAWPAAVNSTHDSLPTCFNADDRAQKTTLEGSPLDKKPEETPCSIECSLEGVHRESKEEENLHQIAQKLENGDQKTAVEWSNITAEEQVEPAYVPGQLLSELEDALSRQRYMTAWELREEQRSRTRSKLTYRSQEIQNLPAFSEEQLRQTNLIEQHCLKLLSIQQKVRSDIVQELRLKEQCVGPDTQLYDWGLMRIRRSGTSHLGHGETGHIVPGTEADERQRRKREAERQRRLEEEERVRETTRKRKFFNELLNMGREFQIQTQAATKRRKQRNDGVQAWHGKQRQRATRAERLRFQALKSDDQEAYMRLVEESKNERLTTLLSRTDDLLQRLGAMVQKQKDAEPEDAFIKKDKVRGHLKDTTKESLDVESVDADSSYKKRDLLEGQRQYNSAVHSIEEKVTVQPAMLQGGTLRQYQIEGLQWMLSLYNNNLNGILADEMGLGKTIQTIALLAYLIENKGVAGPHIIIAPKAVLPNWAHELATWAPSITTVLYDGRAEERRVLREEHGGEGKFNVLVTHYDLIMRDKAFLKKIKWHYMIVDEGHRLKNHDCMLSRTLTSGYHIRRRLLLTGTPIQNSLQELWSLLNFLLPAIFNSSENFEDWFNAPFTDRSDVSLTEEEQFLVIRRLHQVIRPFLLRRKKAEVEKFLPGKTQVILKCDLSAWQRLYYKQIMESGRVGLDSGTGKSRGLLNTAMQLRKCCNHPYLFLEGRDYDPRHSDELIRSSGKFELLDRLLPKLLKTNHRVLLFSQMTRLMDILEDYLEWHGFKYLRLDGTTKTEERGTLLQQFNAPDSPYFMFLLSTRAGGLGLNLQTADTVILFDSDWNPQMDQQAEDRAHRIGQKKEVRVFVLVSVGSIEEEILERAKSKMGIDAKVIQAGLFNTTSTSQERREMLEEIMKRGSNALGTDVPSEREINRLSARGDHEFEIFEEMDEQRRQKEEYRSRLLEEHELPDWVLLNDPRKKGEEGLEEQTDGQITGKRSRKEVLYTDVLSDSQWIKAIEDGEDVEEAVKVQLVKRIKKKEQQQQRDPIDQEVVEMLAGDVNGDEIINDEVGDEEAEVSPDADMISLQTNMYVSNEIQKMDSESKEREDATEPEVKTEYRNRIVFKRKERVHKKISHEVPSKEGGESRLRIVLRPDKVGANWKGLRRKRSKHGSAIAEEDPQDGERKESAEHEDGTDDDNATLDSL